MIEVDDSENCRPEARNGSCDGPPAISGHILQLAHVGPRHVPEGGMKLRTAVAIVGVVIEMASAVPQLRKNRRTRAVRCPAALIHTTDELSRGSPVVV